MKVYTNTQRRALVSAFKKALARLPDTIDDDDDDDYNDYRSPYICDNIGHTSGRRRGALACGLIARRINYAFSIERWLKDQSDKIWREVNHDINTNSGRKMQAYRKAWLRSLIEEFSD